MANAAEECWAEAWKDVRKLLNHARSGSARKGIRTVDTRDLEAWPSASQLEDFAKSTLPAHYTCDEHHQKSSKSAQVLRAVHKYSPVFDVFVQSQPFLASISWGCCRFLVQVAVSGIDLQDNIASALIEVIPRLLTQCTPEINLCPHHPGVLERVKALFIQIILLLLKAREYFNSSKIVRRVKAAFSSTFDDTLRRVHTCVDNLERELNSVSRLAQESYRGESSLQLRRIEENTKSILNVHQETRLSAGVDGMLCCEAVGSVPPHIGSTSPQAFFNWLSESVLEADCIPEAELNTCQGIYQHPVWKDWATLDFPNTLLLTGARGVGKSVLAKEIARKTKLNGERIVLVHYFCGSAVDELKQAKSFAIGILWQLCSDPSVRQCDGFLPILRNFTPVLNRYKLARDSPFKRLLDLLSDILNNAKPFLLVVDAIDECTTDLTILQQFLHDLGHKPHAQVIVTSRGHMVFQNGSSDTSKICLDHELVDPDITYFIKEEICRNPKFIKLKKEIFENVHKHSQGVFLHARLLLEDLGFAKSATEQKAKMARFGTKVSEEYQRLFDEHSAKLTMYECERRDNILRLLITARTLFTFQELSEALAFDEITQNIDTEDIEFEPAEEITRLCHPLVTVLADHRVVFTHDCAREFLLEYHVTKRESELFLARKCLGILTRQAYRDWRMAANLQRKHLLEGTIYESALEVSVEEEPALYKYAVLHFQDHVTSVPDPPEDLVTRLARFLVGIEFVVWSETVFDLRSQSGLGTQLAVYNQLLTWTKFLPAPIKAEIPIEEFYETAHVHLSAILKEQSQDKLLQYLPQIRNAQYFNATGQSTQDWQKAYDNKKSVVAGFTEILGSESPVTLRFRSDLLQEYFWQKRFREALEELLVVSDLQRKVVGKEALDLYTTLWLLAAAYHCLTRFEEALVTFTEAVEGVERLKGTTSRLYLMVGLYKGHTLEQVFRYDEAITLYDNVSQVLVPIVGEDNGFVLMSRTAMGAILRKQGRYEAAERNLLEGWGGRKKLFSINVNVCLDAAVQLALLYRDRGDGDRCLEVLDAVSDSAVYQLDFERFCQTTHIRQLVAFDNGAYEGPKLELLQLLHRASGPNRDKNNRELLWVRMTLAVIMRQHDEDDEAAMLFSDLVEPAEPNLEMLPEEPEPPIRLHLAEQALKLVRSARLSEADALLQRNGLKWVRDEDFWILGEGGPVTDTGCLAPIGPRSELSSACVAESAPVMGEYLVREMQTTSPDYPGTQA